MPVDLSQGLATDPLQYSGTVTASNSTGSATYDMELVIKPKPQIVSFVADNQTYPKGTAPETTLG